MVTRGSLASTTTTPCRSSEAPDQTGPQERVQRHTEEQNIDTFAAVPMLNPCAAGGTVVEVLKIAEMMVPDVEGIPRRGELRELRLVELRRDMAQLVEARHRTAMEVLRWCSDLIRRGVALTSEERYSMLLLMPANEAKFEMCISQPVSVAVGCWCSSNSVRRG